jgi:integrase
MHRRGSIWHIREKVKVGEKAAFLRESTGETSKARAKAIRDFRVNEVKNSLMFGETGNWSMTEACIKYLEGRKPSQMKDAVLHADFLTKYLGDVPIRLVHRDHPGVKRFVEDRQKQVKASTINHTLKVMRNILNDAARVWRDDEGSPWLQTPPLIRLLETEDVDGYPLSLGQEQDLLRLLPDDLADGVRLALFTGVREGVACRLRWEWEVSIPELGVTVFDVPSSVRGVKNGRPHRVVLNSLARDVVERCRGNHPEFVLSWVRKPSTGARSGYSRLNTTSWKAAVAKLGLRHCRGPNQHLRIHDLRHTLATRLRSMDVSLEDRKDLLGHVNGDITTHYSGNETYRMINNSERAVNWYEVKPALTVYAGEQGRSQSRHSTFSVVESGVKKVV